MSFENIAVLGLGKVGKLAAILLHESGFSVTGYDIHTPREGLSFPVNDTDLDVASACSLLAAPVARAPAQYASPLRS